VKEFLWHVDLLVDASRVGDRVVVVGANVLEDLLDVCRAVAGDSDADRADDVSDLCCVLQYAWWYMMFIVESKTNGKKRERVGVMRKLELAIFLVVVILSQLINMEDSNFLPHL